MALVINHNLEATNALSQLKKNTDRVGKDLSKLASGERIKGAGDDPSGYAISEKMRVQERSLTQDEQNAQNGICLFQTAEGAVQNSIDIMRTMKEKAIESANDTNTDEDRAIIQKFIDEAVSQINDNANVTYNGIAMLTGNYNDAVVEGGTYTHLTNQSLATSTTKDTKVVDLLDRSNNSLGIHDDDTITVSWVKNGITKSVSYSPLAYTKTRTIGMDTSVRPPRPITVTETISRTLGELFSMDSTIASDMQMVDGASKGYNYIGTNEAGNDVYTANGENGITLKAKVAGIEGQIAGLAISITDSDGNPRTTVNASLDSFVETIRGQNESPDNALVFQIGTKANQALRAGFTSMTAAALGLEANAAKGYTPTTYADTEFGITVHTQMAPRSTLNVSTQMAANVAINVLDSAMKKALDLQTKIGAETSRLEFTSANVNLTNENTQAAESVIRDADMAKEQTNYARDSLLAQAAQAMLAQANQNGSSVLSLLQ